ncbi:hypothetical protein M8994_14690, partial [Brucella sp. 21LCYQ03]|nr:hypothetical protein [Brucella sp. 21LCYQ03]
ASSVAALVESHIDPTNTNCQRTFIKKRKVSFHSKTNAILSKINQRKQPDSNQISSLATDRGAMPGNLFAAVAPSFSVHPLENCPLTLSAWTNLRFAF